MSSKKVILLVDADPERLGRWVFVLTTCGYRVLQAESATAARHLLSPGVSGVINLLMVNLLLPVMDGNELVRQVKAMRPDLPAVIYSNTVASYEGALAADRFLPKGASSPGDVLDAVRVLVRRKRGPRRVASASPVQAVEA